MKTIERLKHIVDSGNVSANDKKLIKELSEEYKLPFQPEGACKNCYVDQAILILLEMKGDVEVENDGKPRLRKDIDVVINGVRINNATLTDELVEKYRGKGLPEHWWVS